MKISYINLYKYIIYGLVFLNLGFLDFAQNNNPQIQMMTDVVSVFVLLIYLTQRKKLRLNNAGIVLYIFLLFLLVIGEIIRINGNIYSSISVINAINLSRNYLFTLLTFPLFEILQGSTQTERNRFIRNICTLGFCALLVRLIGWYIYNYHGIDLIPGYFSMMGYNWIRGGNVRIGGTFLDGLVFVCTSICFLKTKEIKEKLLSGCVLSIMFLYSYLVYGSRSQIVCYIITFILIYIVNGRNLKKGALNVILILSIIGIFIFSTTVVQNFIASFSINDKLYGAGTMVRVDGQKLYQQKWLENSILFGFGITEDGNYFGLTKYYLSDLGILRNLYQYGVVGLLICIMPFINGLRTSLIGLYNKSQYSTLLLGLTVYTIFSSIGSQNVYDYSRILIIPFILAFIGVVSKNNKILGEK